jgi:hypothetical protein
MSAAEALGYLSPEGERAWVPDWAPEYLHPTTPATAAGTVFRTNHNGQDTTWLILEFEPATGRARYGRFSAGSHIGTVSVDCRELEPARCRVRVAYALTSTSDAGTMLLEAMTEPAYAAMLEEWRRLILSVHPTRHS